MKIYNRVLFPDSVVVIIEADKNSGRSINSKKMKDKKEKETVTETEEEFRAAFLKEYKAQYCYTVYVHIAPDGKRYFGYSRAVGKRWKSGKGYRKNKRFYEAICRIGWDNFKHVILKKELSVDEAREMERRLILEYESWKEEKGYNRVKPKAYADSAHYSVYQLIIPDEKKMYVGSTGNSVEERWNNGNGYRDNPELDAAIRRVGWENVIKIVCIEGVIEESARNMEEYLIEANDTTNPAKGYNKSKGGMREHGWHPTEQIRKLKLANTGSKRTPEQIAHYKKGKEDISTALWCEETQTRYPSIREAARQLQLSKSTLNRHIQAGNMECGGYHFIAEKQSKPEE